MDLTAPAGQAAPQAGSPDVPPGHRFAHEIAWLTRLGLLDRRGDRTFAPMQPVERGQLAQALFRYAGADDGAPAPVGMVATDVSATHPLAREIAWAVRHRLVLVHADGSFRPSRPARRQELVLALHRAIGCPAPTGAPPFRDVQQWHPSVAAIAWAAEAGVVRGMPDGTFRPSRPVTRQALAVLLQRFDELA
ncbi:S-layer homology domain-containing protein [Actinotalea sp. Marseille-Q4924]|uniref:S-layer homology domain-containing protein n=1 Tax=Actinotalea sp. Marseille-Q4924 TaxID=2866571 RepID=UPI001CE4B54D|nr:S-layer homology domain-containing protein [Actinotalea sp. Marseille-Q4924]